MLPPQREHDLGKITVFKKTPKTQPPGTYFGTQKWRKSTSEGPKIAKIAKKSIFGTDRFFTVFLSTGKIEKSPKKGARLPHPGQLDGLRGAGGEVRRGKLSGRPVWSPLGFDTPAPRWGTANLNRFARSPYPRGNPGE